MIPENLPHGRRLGCCAGARAARRNPAEAAARASHFAGLLVGNATASPRRIAALNRRAACPCLPARATSILPYFHGARRSGCAGGYRTAGLRSPRQPSPSVVRAAGAAAACAACSAARAPSPLSSALASTAAAAPPQGFASAKRLLCSHTPSRPHTPHEASNQRDTCYRRMGASSSGRRATVALATCRLPGVGVAPVTLVHVCSMSAPCHVHVTSNGSRENSTSQEAVAASRVQEPVSGC